MIWVLKDERMLVLIGLIAGIAATTSIWVVAERREQPPEQVDVEAVVTQVMSLHKPSENLTEPDLLKVPCSSEFIEQNTDLLCREMFCRMTTRGVDSKTSGGECEQISNIQNKSVILEECSKLGEGYKQCVDLFDRRL
mgnify:FL=1|jgi:hypothetical protein